MLKTRNGFVSNSSSSSFIVALKEGPQDLTLQKVMEIFDVGPRRGPRLLADLQAGFLTRPLVTDPCPTCGHNRLLDDDEYYDSDEDEEKAQFITDNPGLNYYGLTYSDDSGEGDLEHGDHWGRVICKRFSHH